MTTTSIMVRDHNNPSVVATTGSFTVSPAPAEVITVRTPIGAVVGVQLSLFGTYANATPAAIDYSTDAGSTWFPLGFPSIAGGSWSGTGPTYLAVNAAAQIVVRDHGNTAATATTTSFAVAAAPTAGTLLNQNITLTNPAGQPTQANPYFSFGMPIARSEFPSSGYGLALYDASGSTKITDLQVDQTTAGWRPDNSRNYAVVSGYANGTTLAAGSTATFTIKAEPGASPSTPVCTTATLAANSDIKAICVIGTDTYTLSVNQVIASTPATTNPQTYLRQWKSGPYACEWCFGGYIKRNSDGALHRWAFLKLYITALSAAGPYIVRGYLESPNSYGANPAGTVGLIAATTPQVVVDSIDIYNGSTFICAMGGPNDLNNGTFAPSGVNLTSGEIALTFSSGLTALQVFNSGYPRQPFGFTTTGTLPAGLLPASTTTYFAVVDGSTGNLITCFSRLEATVLTDMGAKIATPVAGTVVARFKWFYGAGTIYYASTAGTSTGALPTGGTTFADNSAGGTLVWSAIGPNITSQGTGTHSMVMKSAVWGGSKAAIMGPDTFPHWSGSGSLPKLLIGYDRTYLFGKTRCMPPLDPTITPAAWVGNLPHFVQNSTYLPGAPGSYYIGNVSESAMDERINMTSPTALASAAIPTDAGMAMSCRLMALSWVDRNAFYRDERVQEIVTFNYGPDRLGGTYPSLGPPNPTAQTGQVDSGHPATGNPLLYNYGTGGWCGYGGGWGASNPPDPAHMANPPYWPALTSGDPLFFDALAEAANYVFAFVGAGEPRSAVFGGKNLSWAWAFFGQTRSAGHELAIFAQAEWIWPDAHPAKQYFVDIMDDSAVIGQLWVDAHVGPNGQSQGYLPFEYPSGIQAQAQETWMMSYLQFAHMMEVLKNNRPGFAQFNSTYFYKALISLWDSDQGGSEQFIDQQWNCMGSTRGTSVNLPPLESEMLLNVHDRNAGNPTVFPAFTVVPPAQPLFIEAFLSAQSQTVGGYSYHIPGSIGQIGSGNSAAFGGAGYGLTALAICEMGAMADAEGIASFPVHVKVRDRIRALLAKSYAGNPCNWTAQATTGNLNGIQYAMKQQ